MRKSLLIAAILFLTSPLLMAQLSENIAPMSKYPKVHLRLEVPVMQMPQVDVNTLMAEDEINNATKTGPYRFGETMDTDIEFNNSGVWEALPNGDRIWRLTISSPGAYSLNFIFDGFFMPEGATLHIYNDNGENMLGAFTAKNNRADGGFATYLLAGDAATFEYFEPHEVRGQGTLGISQVIHAYRDVLSGWNPARGGGSGACNNNVICPVGVPWANEINSVTRLVMGGGLCTGALIVDVPQSGTPYYLTANHCVGSATTGSTNTWVFDFNYQSSTCNGTSASNNQSVTGSTLRAKNAGSDFALLELNSAPPEAYNPFLAGWDNSGSSLSNQVCIHHPQGDIKKISFDYDPATQANWQSAATWHIGNWDDGTTEPGSSGSPLFDQNHRVIGQLFGGSATCSNNVDDYFGRFNVSWDASSSNSAQLKHWLDPGNTGATTVDGYDPYQPQVAVDAASQALSGISDGQTLCSSDVTPVFTLKNSGQNNLTSATINWSVDGSSQTPYNWTGNLATNQTDDITFPTQSFSPGAHSLAFSIASANGGADMNANNDDISVSFTTVNGAEMTVSITTDDYGSETSWDITDNGSNVVASGSGYPDGASTLFTIPTCLADGCYTFTIYDGFGDGICCQYGSGSYELLSPNNDVMGSGAQFTDQESVSFCLPFAVVAPSASFTSSSSAVCAPESVDYTNTSTPSGGVTYAWVFEGGTPSTSIAQSPTVNYTSPGTFNVSLTVTNSAGSDVQSNTDYITVHETPSAATSSTGEDLLTGGDNGTATVNASGGTPPYTYNWSAPGTGNTSTITGLSGGNYTVTVTDSEGCATTSTVSVGSNVGINDLDLANSIAVFPNPASDVLSIEFPAESGIIDMTIDDVIGRTISKMHVQNMERMSMNLSNLAEGIYYLNFFTADRKATKKVVHLRK